MFFHELVIGKAKTDYTHLLVDAFTVRGSCVNLQLHQFVRFLDALEKSNTIHNIFWNW